MIATITYVAVNSACKFLLQPFVRKRSRSDSLAQLVNLHLTAVYVVAGTTAISVWLVIVISYARVTPWSFFWTGAAYLVSLSWALVRVEKWATWLQSQIFDKLVPSRREAKKTLIAEFEERVLNNPNFTIFCEQLSKRFNEKGLWIVYVDELTDFVFDGSGLEVGRTMQRSIKINAAVSPCVSFYLSEKRFYRGIAEELIHSAVPAPGVITEAISTTIAARARSDEHWKELRRALIALVASAVLIITCMCLAVVLKSFG